MKIRTKDGSVLDLANVRGGLLGNGTTWSGRTVAGLLDALEAALSVPKRDCAAQSIEMSDYKEGWNESLDRVRQAAGVVEE